MNGFRALVLFFLWGFSVIDALINPVLPGWNPDPTLLRVGDDYFIATSTFEYFPGVPVYQSTDLVNWELLNHVLTRPSQLAMYGTPSDAGVWAPALRYHDGLFYLAVATRYVYTPEARLFPRMFYVTTPDIFSGQWSDPIYVDGLGYDLDLFWDSNGDVYASYAGINNFKEKIYGIYQTKIDIQTGNSLSPETLIFKGVLPNDAASRPEGPHTYLINGTYYLLIAEGGTGLPHRATIQRGPSPSGPWENNPANPILYNGANLTNEVQWTGHADIMQAADGSWWGSALAVVPQRGNQSHVQLGRQTILFPVTWEDGWPVFNDGKPVTLHLDGVLEDKEPVQEYFNQFSSVNSTQKTKTALKSLDPESSLVLDDTFYTVRTPQKPFHSLTANEGHLRIYANPYKVGDRNTPALLLRKQGGYNETFEVVLDDFKPRPYGSQGVGTENGGREEAGITAFYSDFLHQDIGVVASNGSEGRVVVTRTIIQAEQVGPWALTSDNNTVITETKTLLNSTSAPVKLTIKTDGLTYELGFAEGQGEEDEDDSFGEVTWTGSVDASALSLPVAGGFFFKGASFGVYNTGGGRVSLTPADFRYWRQTPGSS